VSKCPWNPFSIAMPKRSSVIGFMCILYNVGGGGGKVLVFVETLKVFSCGL
jgi:hypothetical protein